VLSQIFYLTHPTVSDTLSLENRFDVDGNEGCDTAKIPGDTFPPDLQPEGLNSFGNTGRPLGNRPQTSAATEEDVFRDVLKILWTSVTEPVIRAMKLEVTSFFIVASNTQGLDRERNLLFACGGALLDHLHFYLSMRRDYTIKIEVTPSRSQISSYPHTPHL
jgi:hypothetical protein